MAEGAAARLPAALLASLREGMRARTGNVIPPEKDYWVELRLREHLRASGGADLVALAQRLVARPEAADAFWERLLLTETSFFRDAHAFAAAREKALPELLATRRPARELVVWSCGCASGQEVYSLAMLLDTAFPELGVWQVTVLGTDCSEEALARARLGVYTALEVERGLAPAQRERYLIPHGADWQIAPRLRERVSFRRFNLAAEWPSLPGADLVFLRHVLIYLDGEVRGRVLRRLAGVVRPGGYIFLGGPEVPIPLGASFVRMDWPQAGAWQRA